MSLCVYLNLSHHIIQNFFYFITKLLLFLFFSTSAIFYCVCISHLKPYLTSPTHIVSHHIQCDVCMHIYFARTSRVLFFTNEVQWSIHIIHQIHTPKKIPCAMRIEFIEVIYLRFYLLNCEILKQKIEFNVRVLKVIWKVQCTKKYKF